MCPTEYPGNSHRAAPEDGQYDRGIFGAQPNPEARFIHDHNLLIQYIEACKTLNLKIVLTSGSFDILHIGHARYLEEAKRHGDVLVVGVDSDTKVQKRKGPMRPVVPENERVQMLAHLRSVDIVTLKYPDEPRWELIRQIAPDTLIVTEETYDEATIDELRQLCGRVVSLKPQATTSTSAKIRKMQVDWVDEVVDPVRELMRTSGVSEEVILAVAGLIAQSGGKTEHKKN